MSSYLKIVPELFLEQVELNKLVDFIVNQGYRDVFFRETLNFGLIYNVQSDNLFSNFKVEVGTNAGTYKIAEGFAFDNTGKLIHQKAIDNLGVSVPNTWFWVKVKHKFVPFENGTLSVDTNGNVIGVGTSFLSNLRGQPNIPSRIRLYKIDGTPANNSLDFDVAEITSDTALVLSGAAFVNETNLMYSIVGTFNPDAVIPSINQEIFQYDSCDIQLVQEVTDDIPPASITGEEFYIARLQKSSMSGLVVVHDKRKDFWQVKADYDLKNVLRTANPLVGVEKVLWDKNLFATREDNQVHVSWGFRSSNYTIEPSARRITISQGIGGRYKSTNQVQNGDFNGWRLYIIGDVSANYPQEGRYFRVLDSVITGTIGTGIQVNLTLDNIDPLDFQTSPATSPSTILLVPDAETIEFWCVPTGSTNVIGERKVEFNINNQIAILDLLVYSAPTADYKVYFRFRQIREYTKWLPLPDDVVGVGNPDAGYYTEDSYDDDGVLKVTTTRYSYTSGVIRLKLASTSYNNFNLGDIVGVQYNDIDVQSSDINGISKTLQVRVDKQWQVFRNSSPTQSLVRPTYINLKTTDAREGNRFIIDFRFTAEIDGTTLSNGFAVVQDLVIGNPYSAQNKILEISPVQLKNIAFRQTTTNLTTYPVRFCAMFIFDANGQWICRFFEEPEVLKDARFAGTFPIGGMLDWPTTVAPSGFLKCEGQAINRTTYASLFALIGTTYGVGDASTTFNLPDIRNRFVVGAGTAYVPGDTGGANNVTLDVTEIPAHTHTMDGAGSHNHGGITGGGQADFTPAGGGVPASRQPQKGTPAGINGDNSFIAGDDQGQTGAYQNDHAHTISSDGDHTHTINSNTGGGAHENRPPYFALTKIIRVI